MSSIVLPLLIGCVLYLYCRQRKAARMRFIDQYRFHPAIGRKVRQRYPHLTDQQLDQVFSALRDYFHICNRAGRRMVAMPSQVVDVAWHEFILFTRAYNGFCKRGFGRFLHHTPVEAMQAPTLAQDGIKRAWRLACIRSGIDPRRPLMLPPLFAIDTELGIEDGFKYVLDCANKRSPAYGDGYCASHIGCGSSCAGGCGGDSGSSDSGGGSDCGGGGCGGGD